MSNYVGIQTQVRKNNLRSMVMLMLFPVLVAVLVWLFLFLITAFSKIESNIDFFDPSHFAAANSVFLPSIPWVLGGCVLWFLIAYFINVRMIQNATGSHSLSRQDNKRVYNLVENLCMSKGMKMPMINVIEDSSLNAFASGINDKSYTVTLTRGIMDRLSDDELEGVIAHELTHIRNRDVRLLIVTIVFVGIFTVLAQALMRKMLFSRGKKNIVVTLVGLAVVAIGYFFSVLMRFAISRNREYMADAGAAEMTKKPAALASALRKISGNSQVESVRNQEVAQLFIENALEKKSTMANLFASHPPIEKRIQVLENF